MTRRALTILIVVVVLAAAATVIIATSVSSGGSNEPVHMLEGGEVHTGEMPGGSMETE